MNTTSHRRCFLATAATGSLAVFGGDQMVRGTESDVPAATPFTPSTVDPREFGAVGDGATPATAAIPKAVDHVAGLGGGTVRLSEGRWLTGTVYLAGGVTLLIDRGATLLGSRDIADYGMPRKNIRIADWQSIRSADSVATRFTLRHRRSGPIGSLGTCFFGRAGTSTSGRLWQTELYDMVKDPEELRNLALEAEHRERLLEYHEAALAELRRIGAGMVDHLPPVREATPLEEMPITRSSHQ